MFFSQSFIIALTLLISVAANSHTAATDLASLYGFATSTSMPFPTATQSPPDTQNLIVSSWSLSKGRIQNGADNIAFVDDPFPTKPPTGAPGVASPAGPVLEVTYPAKSFSNDTGGSQFINLWNHTDGSTFLSMMLNYEVAFDAGFDWVKGGKLPGLRGGLSSTGCSGGNQPDGKDCFSSRVMWRTNGAGEDYAYMPTTNNICSQNDVLCNDDFGVSLSRSSFSFGSGQWNRMTMLVRLNDPPTVANGNIQLYYNDLLALNHTGLQIRTSSTLQANGLFFSTFFGGSDSSWATPVTTHAYFRSIQLWGGSSPSNLTGPTIKSHAQRNTPLEFSSSTFISLVTLFGMYYFLSN